MKVLVTCGPAYAEIDEVRRITNFATGEIGSILHRTLSATGHKVTLYRGSYATHPIPPGLEAVPFTTNDDLLGQLTAGPRDYSAIFHAAALNDYEVASLTDDSGTALAARKIPSRAGEIQIRLRPATKLLPLLRGIFPQARIVGWKYELDGTPEEAIARGRSQITTCETDACVVNGAAFGSGFGFCPRSGEVVRLAGKQELASYLADWITAGQPAARPTAL